MSPLIDVTNTGSQSCFVPNKASKEVGKRNKSTLSDGLGQGVGDITKRSLDKNINDSQREAISMCNTRTKSGIGNKASQGSLRNITHGHCMVDAMRVPPLPPQTTADDVLSKAVEALSLNPFTASAKPSTTRLNRHHHRQSHSKQNGRRSAKVTASSSGVPDNRNGADVVRTPQQCGACGLEFTSLSVLTQHLAKHVYDGLYAAQWLTQAMTLVSSRQFMSSDRGGTASAEVHSVPNEDDDNGNSLTLQGTQSCTPSGS